MANSVQNIFSFAYNSKMAEGRNLKFTHKTVIDKSYVITNFRVAQLLNRKFKGQKLGKIKTGITQSISTRDKKPFELS